jgi:hypothetical protein
MKLRGQLTSISVDNKDQNRDLKDQLENLNAKMLSIDAAEEKIELVQATLGSL